MSLKTITMGMMLVLFLASALSSTLNLVPIAAAVSATAISVEPPAILDETLVPESSFKVNITITDVMNFGGYEFKLSYNSSLLHVTDVTVVTDWFGPSVKVWKKTFNGGLVWLIVTLPPGTIVGVDGSGTVATIDFEVDDYGITVLDLHDTLLGDPFGNPIIHQVNDGFFANVPLPQLWIKGHGAMGGGVWPEWHVGAPGTEQTLYARIVNTGDVGCYVKVAFSVYSPAVGAFSPVWSNVAWVDPKPLNESVIVSATFTETNTVGVYYVRGALWFSLDGALWVPYSALEDVLGGCGTTRDVAGNDACKFIVKE